MKKVFAILAVLAMAGCGTQMAQEVNDQVNAAPQEFWAAVKEVLGFVWQIIVNLLTGWLSPLIG